MTCRILQATALFDARGAGYEYAPQNEVEGYQYSWGYRQHAKFTEIEPGMFTDDTMLSAVAAKALLHEYRYIPPERRAAEKGIATFVQTMFDHHKAHPSEGYSKRIRAGLYGSDSPTALYNYFSDGNNSASNGAAMRSAVYGVLPTLEHAMREAETMARITHSGYGVEAAKAVAAASFYMYHDIGPKDGLNTFLAAHVDPIWTLRTRERVAAKNGPLAVLTVAAALTAVRENDTFTGVLEQAIRVGGDTDTVAAIAGGIAISCRDIRDDIPKEDWAGIKPVSGFPFEELVRLDIELETLGVNGPAE